MTTKSIYYILIDWDTRTIYGQPFDNREEAEREMQKLLMNSKEVIIEQRWR